MNRPYVWQMVKQAIDNLKGEVSNTYIKNYIKDNWGEVNPGTINDQILIMTVNREARINWKVNCKPRLTNSNSKYDLLYTTNPRKVVKYDLTKHGIWEIYKIGNDKFGIRKIESISTVNTFLFAWNPIKWNWTTLEQSIEQLEKSGKVTERWSCLSHKIIKPGDRAFLVRLGSEPRGIFASGYVVSEPFLSKHWSDEGKNIYRVLIEFEVLLNPDKEPILALDNLKTGNLGIQEWTPQSSGISVKPELVEELEAVWFNFLTTQNIRINPYASTDGNEKNTYTEGTAKQMIQTRYERNPYAKVACIKHYGYSCSVCEFDFEKRFGDLGKNFIHVHHLTLVSTVGKTEVDPIKDLRPVCPNCHAMLHRQNPPLTIEKLKMWLTC